LFGEGAHPLVRLLDAIETLGLGRRGSGARGIECAQSGLDVELRERRGQGVGEFALSRRVRFDDEVAQRQRGFERLPAHLQEFGRSEQSRPPSRALKRRVVMRVTDEAPGVPGPTQRIF